MPELTQAYDRALQIVREPSVQGALRLRAIVQKELTEGTYSRAVIYDSLQALMDQYLEAGQLDDAEAVAQVLDSFGTWAPYAARF